MKILLSINPEYVDKIFSGEKKIEYRRSIFKNKEIKTIVIYSTSPIKKIVGEFTIKKIIKDAPIKLWNLSPKSSGISEKKFYEYFKDKKEGYAIIIDKVIKYDNYKLLEDLSIKTAPQSFIYLP